MPLLELTMTRAGEQSTLFQDGLPLVSTGDLGAEARTHPAMAQIPEGAAVLLVGGAPFGAAAEAARHQPSRLVSVEPDGAVYAAGEEIAPLPNNLERLVGDARRFVRRQRNAFDLVLVHLPGPESAQLNRYYSAGFFAEVHHALRRGGVLAFTFPSSADYLSEEQVAMERSVLSAVQQVFTHVAILPGEDHLILAADRPLDLEVEPILRERGIITRRFLDYDWHEMSDPFRREQFEQQLLDQESPPNQDLIPRAFGHLLEMRARMSPRGVALIVGAVILSALAAILFTAGRGVRMAVGSTGFAVMALELEILLCFQVAFGNLYLWLALLVTLFLMAAAAGAWHGRRLSGRTRDLAGADAAILVSALVVAAVGWAMTSGIFPLELAGVFLPLLLAVIAVAAGAQFAAAGAAEEADERNQETYAGPCARESRKDAQPARAGRIVGRLYLADLAGAASGTIAAGLLLLPKGGVLAVTVTVVVIKLASLAGLMRRRSAS